MISEIFDPAWLALYVAAFIGGMLLHRLTAR